MSFVCFLAITAVCSLLGICCNVWMLCSCCFNAKRPLVVCQFVAQVMILAVNIVETWNELDNKWTGQEESCLTFYKLVLTFATFFSCGNLLAIMMTAIRSGSDPSVSRARESIPILLAGVVLSFLSSGIVWWYSCFTLERESRAQLAVSGLILVEAVAVLVFMVWRTRDLDHTTPKTIWTSSLLDCLCEKFETVLFVVLFLMCFGIMTTQISQPPVCESVQTRAKRAGEKALFLLIMNFTAGIAMPLTVMGLNESRCEKEIEEMKVVIM